ncbi:unnamed protein product [Ceratitis capitata]|uniref:(Mediterranean fruit fly) hypothetical protein n=1 Tax=Ceratitis capitata TaxID=7213 RepID=A0A811UA24_CERCA|nr:unnamed protein product [Ceratitis capitata]
MAFYCCCCILQLLLPLLLLLLVARWLAFCPLNTHSCKALLRVCCCIDAINMFMATTLTFSHNSTHIHASIWICMNVCVRAPNIGDIWSRLIASFSSQTIWKLSRKSTDGKKKKLQNRLVLACTCM